MRLGFKLILSILLGLIVFCTSYNSKFYGFEYEDAFINSYVGSQDNYFSSISNFRTDGCKSYINGECVDKSSFTGHYIIYSFYLYLINSSFDIEPFFIHKLANFLLIFFSFFGILFFNKDKEKINLFFILSIVSSLPFIYVFNSSLIENLSFFIGITIVVLIGILNNRKDIKMALYLKIIVILLILLITIVKRENLIYILLFPLFLKVNDFKNYKVLILFIFFLFIQVLINPFYTEFIEAEFIKKPTFSFEYLAFQLPSYLKSFLSIKGFLPITLVCIFLVKPTKKSFYFLFLFFIFIIIYSLHYRSQFAILNKSITLFDTYRYMVNTIPFLFGFLTFSEYRVFKKIDILIKAFVFILLGSSFIHSLINLKYFIEEEKYDYHIVNDDIANSIFNLNKVIILDNFALISILNTKNSLIEIHELDKKIIKNLIKKNKDIYIINRFNLYDLNDVKNLFKLIKIESLSNNRTEVFMID